MPVVEDFSHTVLAPSVLVEAMQIPPELVLIPRICAIVKMEHNENKRYQLISGWPFLSGSEIQNLLLRRSKYLKIKLDPVPVAHYKLKYLNSVLPCYKSL